ncbi:RNA polymerase sigma factor [Sphingomonas sp. NPDC019816]|uniref:RNA polymerase sigma factor n=1 Tax=unclassified Sphingomonas TaxID=196159 RepID=UPI00289D94B2|nr:RNA polymerase sigma factor [Sphingomonas sp.]
MNDTASSSQRDPGRVSVLRDLVTSYSRPLTRYFQRRVAVSQDVPDLVQEVFLRLSRMNDPADIRERDSFIFVTAANVLRDRARRDRAGTEQRAVFFEESMEEGSEFPPDRVLEGKQAVDCIRQALAEIPERTRDVFVLRILEGWKMNDVARSLGISTRAAEKHQARALAHITVRLEEQGHV